MSVKRDTNFDPAAEPLRWLEHERSQPSSGSGLSTRRPQLCALAAAGATSTQQLRWLAEIDAPTDKANLSRWWTAQRAILREAGFDETQYSVLAQLGSARLRKPQAVAILKNMKIEKQPAEILASSAAGIEPGQAPKSGQPASVSTAPPKAPGSPAADDDSKKQALKNLMNEMQQELATGVKSRSLLPTQPPGSPGKSGT